MTAPAEAAAAALLLAERSGERLDALPAELRPATLAEGHAIQDAFATQWGAPVAGWKIGATSAGGRVMLGVDGPVSDGFSQTVFSRPATRCRLVPQQLA